MPHVQQKKVNNDVKKTNADYVKYRRMINNIKKWKNPLHNEVTPMKWIVVTLKVERLPKVLLNSIAKNMIIQNIHNRTIT